MNVTEQQSIDFFLYLYSTHGKVVFMRGERERDTREQNDENSNCATCVQLLLEGEFDVSLTVV